jgi:hypothetical protein
MMRPNLTAIFPFLLLVLLSTACSHKPILPLKPLSEEDASYGAVFLRYQYRKIL